MPHSTVAVPDPFFAMSDFVVDYLPSQWRAMDRERLRYSACAVVDVIRATSTIVTALANGAASVQPVTTVEDAFALKAKDTLSLLAGERGGKPVAGFDMGNSPEDFTAEKVKGRRIILTTTNGTQALAACHGAREVMVAGLLNLNAVATRMRGLGPPWMVVCAGCNGQFGLDDAVVAGALADALETEHPFAHLYRSVKKELPQVLLNSMAGQELAKVGLDRDIPFCAQMDLFSVVPVLDKTGLLVAARED